MKGYCMGCGALLKTSGSGAHYCPVCSGRLRSIMYQVKQIMKQAGLKLPEGVLCVDCGRLADMYDHRYYSRPLDVVPVCRGCNKRRGPARDVADVLRNGLLYVPKFSESAPAVLVPRLQAALDEFERQAITKALEEAKWNRTKAAAALGITFRAMRYRMERLKIA